MNSRILKTLSIMLSLTLIISICAFAVPMHAYASGLAVSTSASYQGSVYYQRACTAYSSNADPRTRFVQVALSQKGYKGGTASGQWAGNGGGGRYTEYGRFMKKDGLDWCASFVSWCAAAAGIPTGVIPRSASAGHWRSPGTGTYTPIWSNNYTTYNPYKPQVGDLCLYMPYCTTCNKHYNAVKPTAHVVIVAAVENNQNSAGGWNFTTIERGNNNTVESHTISTKMKRGANSTCSCGKQTPAGSSAYVVQGFWRPDWSKVSSGGNTSSNTVTANVALTAATQGEYVAKEFIAETNACVVTQITKPAGTTVSQCGLTLMDSKGNVLKNYSENISNVGKNTTLFHSWYDMNTEVGYTLSKGTIYKYRFFTVVDGIRYEGETRSFTTKGDYNLYFDANGGSCTTNSKKVISGGTLGTLPTPVRNGYRFTGWYNQKSNGALVTDASYFTGNSDATIYAGWEQDASKTLTIGYSSQGGTGTMPNEVYQYGQTITVKNCNFTKSGKEFYKWTLYRSADETFYTPQNGWQTFDNVEKYSYGLKGFNPGDKLTVSEELMEGCNQETMFYFVAVWQDAAKGSCTIGYDPYGGSGKMASSVYEYGETMTVADSEFTNSGKEFYTWVLFRAADKKYLTTDNGWQTAESLMANNYNLQTFTPGKKLVVDEDWATDVSGDQTFYFVAIWQEAKNSDDLVIKLYIDNPKMRVAGIATNIDNQGTAPCIINGRTMIPIRALIEAMGGTVGWNGTLQQVNLELDGKTLFLRIGENYAFDNQNTYALDSAPVLMNGRTLLPVRAIVEYFGGEISWDASTRCVTINYSK